MSDISFVWKPHPAEFNLKHTKTRALIEECIEKLPNVTVARPSARTDVTLTELVKACRMGIATVGTALLDFEMYRRPCLCFSAPAVESLIDHLESTRTFATYSELLSEMDRIADGESPYPVTGYLAPFSADALRETIRSNLNHGQSKLGMMAIYEKMSLLESLKVS